MTPIPLTFWTQQSIQIRLIPDLCSLEHCPVVLAKIAKQKKRENPEMCPRYSRHLNKVQKFVHADPANTRRAACAVALGKIMTIVTFILLRNKTRQTLWIH